MFQFLHTDLALANESGVRNEKMLAKRSKGRLLHIDIPENVKISVYEG